MNKFVKASLAVSLMAATTASAFAQSMGSGDLTIGGFGTLGIARTNTDAAQFVRYNQAEGVTTDFKVGTDSNLGLQATYKFSPDMSGTVQVLTRKNTSPTFTTELTWAFLKAKLNDDFSVRGGRIVIPVFMISDYQNVGFANTMIRPPIELYGQAPLESADGADVTYQHSYGDTTVTAQAILARATGKLFVAAGGGSVAHYKAPLAAISVAVENGPFSARIAQLSTNIGADDFTVLNSLTGTLTGAGFGQLAKDMTLVGGKRINFTALGTALDYNNFVVQTEYGMRRAKEPVYIADTDAWYLMAGYRIGKVLPYYAHASSSQGDRSVKLPAGFPTAGALYTAVNTSFLTANLQKTDIIGVRWDFAKSLAFKAQVDRVNVKTKTGALIFGPATGLATPVTAISFAVDAVF